MSDAPNDARKHSWAWDEYYLASAKLAEALDDLTSAAFGMAPSTSMDIIKDLNPMLKRYGLKLALIPERQG